MKKYVLVLDQGTTSCRAILFDREQRTVAVSQRELTQYYPADGWVEQDAEEILDVQLSALRDCLARSGISAGELAGLGVTNQRETTVVWDKISGRPVCRAIVWQCRRTAPLVAALIEQGWDEHIRCRTGLIPDAYFSATKIKWILDNVPGVRQRAERGELLFGTIDSWLIWNLTQGRVHATDRTNASRTMLYDISALDWDEQLLRALDIPYSMLPQVKDSSGIFGETELDGVAVPIAGVAGDQQAALFGQCCFERGQAKNTYGTGCFLLANTGRELCRSQHGLISTIAVSLGDEVQYALEGSVFVGGAVVQWLRDELRLIDESCDIAYFARKVSDTGGVYLVPAFTGLGAPHWDMYARGCLVGMTRGTKREHLLRAAEESIAYQSHDVVKAMEADLGSPITSLKADGGASRDSFLMQFQADILAKPVLRPREQEATALGAAYLAGLATGLWRDQTELAELWQQDAVFAPQMDGARREDLLRGWDKAVGRSLHWCGEK